MLSSSNLSFFFIILKRTIYSFVLLKETRGKTDGFSDWSLFFLSKAKRGTICHRILSEGQEGMNLLRRQRCADWQRVTHWRESTCLGQILYVNFRPVGAGLAPAQIRRRMIGIYPNRRLALFVPTQRTLLSNWVRTDVRTSAFLFEPVPFFLKTSFPEML
ncbi:hypothetical protein QNI19_29975 [Cytophagaceae bacterium DM2B3-1]|uniref:Uncharacterized protein n=1 Tax=Xanthocytophaga flava TaxID=3048013 RepID=A0ABT7CTX1_9BACT|nr:hypothetical protein [Xanthocytophaga flavus]MDJ1497204.1 hypothetical protein [Xanthocytophaga flavus]